MESKNKKEVVFSVKKWPITGNKRIVESLKNIILKDSIPHALLFSGSYGLGKKIMARNFIKTILCKKDSRPCGKCASCVRLEYNTHPDFISLSNKKSLQIKDVRKLKHKLSLSPSLSKYKVCLLSATDHLTKEVANALLKILEEPRGNTIIVLLAENCDKLLDTITSRCIIFEFTPLNGEEIKMFLEGKRADISKKDIEKIIFRSNGKIDSIRNYLNKPSLLGEDDKIISDMVNVISERDNYFEKMDYVNKISKEEKDKLYYMLNVWIYFCREIIYYKLGLIDFIDNRHNKIVQNFNTKRLKEVIHRLCRTKLLLSRNINKKLLLENLFLNI